MDRYVPFSEENIIFLLELVNKPYVTAYILGMIFDQTDKYVPNI